MFRQITTFDTEISDDIDEDVEYQPQIWVCRSDYHNVWLGKYLIDIRRCIYNVLICTFRAHLWIQGAAANFGIILGL